MHHTYNQTIEQSINQATNPSIVIKNQTIQQSNNQVKKQSKQPA